MRKLFVLFSSFIGVSTLVLIVFLIRWVILTDISVQPLVESNTRVDAPVYLISYADGHPVFVKNQRALAWSALDKGIDFILNYGRSHLDSQFVLQNKSILSEKAGAGYWLWKPYVIAKTLNEVPENALVVYSDSGFVFKGNLEPLLQLALKQDMVLLHYEDTALFGTIGKVAKRNVFTHLGCDTEQCRSGPHLWAAFGIYRNTPTTRAFVARWLKLCEDRTLLLPGKSHLPEYPEFRGHQHDEAIVSVLYQKQPQGIYLYPVTDFLAQYAAWHHRHPGKEYQTAVTDIWRTQMRGIERNFWNHPWVIQARAWLLEKSA